MGDTEAQRLFLDNLPLIDRIVAATCRRRRLTREETEDFASVVNLKLIANDYETLRAFEGRSSLAGYLTAVVQRAFLDHCNHLWGKWRPSVEATRLGPLAVHLDTQLHRDGMTLAEVCGGSPPEQRQELERLATLLPARVRRKMAGEEKLKDISSGDSPEERLLAREREEVVHSLGQALESAVSDLDPSDRLLLQLRLYEGVTLASAARALGRDARLLYRRWETLMRQLRGTLEEAGYHAPEVAWALGGRTTEESGGWSPRPSPGRRQPP